MTTDIDTSVTFEVTVSRKFAELVLMHPEEHADVMIGVVMGALYKAVRDQGPSE